MPRTRRTEEQSMTTRTQLTNEHNNSIGYIETDGPVTRILNIHNVVLGSFDARDGWTKNVHGTVIGRGNLLLTLLPPQRR